MSRTLRLQMILSAAGNATKFLKGVRNDTDATSKALRAARERVSELQRSTKNVASYRKGQEGLDALRGNIVSARAEVVRLGTAMDNTKKPSKSMARAFELSKTKLTELIQKEQGQIRQLSELDAKLKTAGISTKSLGAHELRLKRDLESANRALDQQKSKLEELQSHQKRMAGARARYDSTQAFAGTAAGAGASAIAAGAAVGAPLVMAGRAAVNFQDAMLDVQKVVDFDTPQQFKAMKGDILDLSSKTGLAAEEIAQIVAAAGQAKIPRDELIGFTDDASQMAVAFGTSAEDAGQKMATWRTAFGMNQDAVRGLADQVNYLGDTGNATAMQISEVLTRIGPLGGVAGLAAAEVAALGATTVAFGTAEEVAATGIKNTMLALTKGTAATKAQATAYKALGFNAEDVAKAMQVDASGTIVDVLERISKLSPERQVSILTQLFGSESVGAISPMLSQLDVLKTNLDAVSDAQRTAGSMALEFENRQSGAAAAIDRARQSTRNLGITVGDNFVPIIDSVAQKIDGATQHLRKFAEAHPNVIKVGGILVGIVAGALLIFGGLALAVAAVLGPFALMRLALAMTSPMFAPILLGLKGMIVSTWAWTAALLANPVTLIVMAIVAAVALLAGGVYLIYKNWGTIGPWFAGVWAKVKELGSAAIRGLIGLFMNFSPVGILLQAFQKVWPALSGLGERFKSIGGDLIKGLINGLMGGLPGVLSAIANLGGKLITGLKNKLGIRSPSRVFAGLGDETVAGLTQGVNRSSGSAVSAVARVGAGMTAALAVGAGASPSMSFDNGSRITPPSAASRSGTPQHIEININIHQMPGQDEALFARLVGLEVQKIMAGQNNASYSDDPDGLD